MEDQLYTYELAYSYNQEPIGQFTQGRRRNLQLALNRGGSASITLPLTDDLGMQVEEVNTCIRVFRNDTLLWSGPVWTIEETVPGDQMTVNAVGWIVGFDKKIDITKTIFTLIDAGQIVYSLMAVNAPPSQFPYISAGTREMTQNRTRTYEKYIVLASEIQSLSEIESGFDYIVDPQTRALNIYDKIGQDRDVVFGYNWGPNNVAGMTRNTDASAMSNNITVQGKYTTVQAQDATSIADYGGEFDEHYTLSDVTDVSILGAFANAELEYKKRPRQSFTMNPKPWKPDTSIPRIFEDFGLGDTVELNANKGRLQVYDQRVRLFGFTVEPGDDGGEKVSSLQFTAGGGG